MVSHYKIFRNPGVFFPASRLLMILFITFLTACGSSDNKSNAYMTMQKQTVKKFDKQVTLKGEVSNESGILKNADIRVLSEQGVEIVNANTNSEGRYQVDVPAGTELPIIIQAGNESGADKLLKVVAIDPGIKRYDINVLTTAIAKKAKSLGGYNYTNMSQAAMSSTSVPNSNQTTGGFSGDPTRQYGGWH